MNTNPIRAYRALHDLKLEQFAELVGSKKAAVSKWENGRGGPSPLKAREIEEKTGIPKEAIRPDIFGSEAA